MLVRLGDIDREVHGILHGEVPVAGDAHQVRASRFALRHVGERLLEELGLGQHADDQRSVLDEADGSQRRTPRSGYS